MREQIALVSIEEGLLPKIILALTTTVRTRSYMKSRLSILNFSMVAIQAFVEVTEVLQQLILELHRN